MKVPGEQQWQRVEELGRKLSDLPPEGAAAQMAELAAAGESPTVLTLLASWLEMPTPPPGFEPGTVLGGRYKLIEKIGDGGMGSVWRAKQELISREVAVKMIHPALVTPDLQARFLAEMEVLGQLNHPGIVHIFDAGLEELL